MPPAEIAKSHHNAATARYFSTPSKVSIAIRRNTAHSARQRFSSLSLLSGLVPAFCGIHPFITLPS
jgi:hypothetical protein